MKIIFLDVDGVLNSREGLEAYKKKHNITGPVLYTEVEDVPLQLIKEIVDATSARIVVSSSWRNGCERSGKKSPFGDRLYNILEARLREYGMEIYDITPSLGKGEKRGDEIRAWLAENPTEEFVILDDDSDMCEYVTDGHFIQTTYDRGLTEKLKDKAIELLGL